MPKFAIVIPNLNQSHFLITALESLRHQTVPFELAVMDGGSTDNYESVVNDYYDISSYSRSDPDGGQSAAISESTNKISGDIMTWLNADDYYFPGALDKVHDIFKTNPDVDVVYGDAIHVNTGGLFQCYFPPIKNFDKNDLTRNCFICQPACFFRRKIYDDVGGIDTSLNFTMDWDLWCRFSKCNARFYYLQEPLAAVRYYPSTKTLSGSKERFQEIFNIEKKYGNRKLKRSVISFYYYGLTHKKVKNIYEKLFMYLFNIMRKLKNQKNSKARLYGFHRWAPVFEKKCQIHLPWYQNHDWKKLRFKFAPACHQARIELNGEELEVQYNRNGEIIATLPKIISSYIIISIAVHDDRTKYKLMRFSCDV